MNAAKLWGVRLAKLLGAVVLAAAVAWARLLLQFTLEDSPAVATAAAGAMTIVGFFGVLGVFVRRLRPAIYATFAAFGATAIWWQTIVPSNDREWQVEVSRTPWAEVNGDLVTIHDIRNFDYRTETDFTPQWYDKTYDLTKLDEFDLIASYWMGDDIAHIMVSFGFGGTDYVTASIETRKEVGESYSTLAGFFRRYELVYVVADERDLVRVRTNYRKDPPEDVYLYRTAAPPENVRRLFLDYVREMNELRTTPMWYNTMTTNCTTTVWFHSKVNGGLPFSWKLLASGHTPEYAWQRGGLDTSIPFAELRKRSHVNEAAKAADDAPDFSERIRAKVPTPRQKR